MLEKDGLPLRLRLTLNWISAHTAPKGSNQDVPESKGLLSPLTGAAKGHKHT